MVPTVINIYRRKFIQGSRDPTTTIIIAASISAGGLVLVLIFFRIFWRCCRRQVVPLPPVQPLAHVREQRLAQFVDRNDPAFLSPPTSFSHNGSKVSLLRREPSSFSTPSSDTSLGLTDTGEVVSALSNQAEASCLPQDVSQSSLGSEIGTTSLPETPHSFNSSSISRHRSKSSTQSPLPDRARSTSRSRLRPRPLSMTSGTFSTTSRNSRLIRGVPHGPHSDVKIVLPAPLASVLHPYMEGRHSFAGGEGDDSFSRLSVVDKWTPGVIKSSGPISRESRSLSLDRASSSSRSSISRVHTPPHRLRTMTSSPSLPAGPSPTPYTRSQPARAPPVPRIPSMYTFSELDRGSSHQEEEANIRGRPRGVSASRSPPNSRTPQKQLEY